jgi:hypothetical protein
MFSCFTSDFLRLPTTKLRRFRSKMFEHGFRLPRLLYAFASSIARSLYADVAFRQLPESVVPSPSGKRRDCVGPKPRIQRADTSNACGAPIRSPSPVLCGFCLTARQAFHISE